VALTTLDAFFYEWTIFKNVAGNFVHRCQQPRKLAE